MALFAAPPQISPLAAANPLQDLLAGLQQGIALRQLPQQQEQAALQAQLAQAIQQAKLAQLQGGAVENVGGRLVRYNPQTQKVEVLLDAAPTPTNFQFAGYTQDGRPLSYDPRNNALVVPQVPEGLNLTGPLQPKTLAPETFSTVASDQGLMRAGNRSTTAVPLTVGDTQVQTPVKPTATRQVTDKLGFLYNQPVAGGPLTPVLDPNDGTPFNAGVANKVFESDQGIFTVPTKSQGAPTPTPLTTTGSETAPGTPLTKTKSGSKDTSKSEADTKEFLNNLSDSAIATIEELKPRISNTTVGLGSYLAGVRGTDAAGFDARVKSLASDIRLGVLQQMKSISKTGSSGLGALSNQEGKSLESALGSLETSQGPADFKSSLDKVESSIRRWKLGVEKFGIPNPSGDPSPQSPNITVGTVVKQNGKYYRFDGNNSIEIK